MKFMEQEHNMGRIWLKTRMDEKKRGTTLSNTIKW